MEQTDKNDNDTKPWDGPLTLCTTDSPPPYVPPSRIAANLYVGCEYASVNAERLQKDHGIVHVIVAAHKDDTHLLATTTKNTNNSSCDAPMRVTVLGINDRPSEQISRYFEQVYNIYSALQEGEALLIHCISGVSRSGAIAVALLMKTCHLSYENALALARQGRPCISPNRGFRKQLKSYEDEL